MNFPWTKTKPAAKNGEKPSYKGMSGRGTTAEKIVQDVKAQKVALPNLKNVKVPNPLKPYLNIVKGDIKRVFGIDENSRSRKELYNDFMEEHFGRK